ncbi:putative phosphatidylinositol glycan [Blattamonas nauphoetae]|uniref:N-acetylglucosaminylphosphatidylinositol deacetylase n=1 Tax=Blattamonas nauphoetae TaxID=2049346 RepID=A0ABQ9Y4B0_9EUKA|nr:putative phosphatidylinositol glycan [Blattamonas nauphoetae]
MYQLIHDESIDQRSNLPLEMFGDKVLIATAHPDDESAFFSPTIRLLKDSNRTVGLLSLSLGEACDGPHNISLAKIRLGELQSACNTFGIPKNSIFIGHTASQSDSINTSANILLNTFPDGKQMSWSSFQIARTLQKVYQQYPFTSVLTFDYKGISGHPNHIAVRVGIEAFRTVEKWTRNNTQRHIRYFEQVTNSLFERLLGPVRWFVPCSLRGVRSRIFGQSKVPSEHPMGRLFQVCGADGKPTREAMAQHRSQLRFHRRWLNRMSFYSYSNVIREIHD